ncbi:MAG: glutamylcysteine synthetase [Lachnospiraceae bacterium]|jgi:gamma-glutamylcysteine synthetase|nr:glutamylcysteine synthetase [Lachnospiraceae bacterium]
MSQIIYREVKERLYDRYIAPIGNKKSVYAGIELELPIVNLRREAADFTLVHDLTFRFGQSFNFVIDKFDDEGNPLALIDYVTGDIFTFDCSYNTLELSLGITENLWEAEKRIRSYLEFIQTFLQKHDHTLVGMGTNPYREYNKQIPIPNGRYRMLFHHLSSYQKYCAYKRFLPYPAFGMFIAASQTQLDILPGRLIRTLKTFNALEPYKSVLFANSPMKNEGLLLSRDRLWGDSMQGFNSRNVGMHDPVPKSEDELLSYWMGSSLYCTQRGDKYYNFAPTPLREYYAKPKITAEYFKDGCYHTEEIEPSIDDLEYFRTFKFQDPTFRGTIEFRSVCTQPLRERMTSSAFHLGLIDCLDELDEVLSKDPLYKHGMSAASLRELLNKEHWPDFIDREALSKTLIRILTIAEKSLRNHQKGEEEFLQPLYDRAQRLMPPAREYTDRRLAGESEENLILDFAALS